MFAATIIVFREVLEAALILSIVAAATKNIAGRTLWLLCGVVGGTVGSLVVAAFANEIAEALDGVGQELFNASVLGVAVLMLGWHNIWMQRHGRELAVEMNRVGSDVSSGHKSLMAVTVAVALAVLREGSEVVLFLYGIASGGASATDLALGSALGLATGGAAGWALYAGLLSIPMRHLFATTSWLILFLAAGMSATAAKFLTQADMLPALGNNVWDTSAWLAEDTVLGEILHVMVGYVARPSGIQLLFYTSTIAIIGGLMFALHPRRTSNAKPAGVAVALVLVAAMVGVNTPEAKAGFKVYTPYVDYHELEIEYRPSVTIDGDATKDNGQTQLLGIGYGVNQWWFTEVYAEWEREPGAGESTSFESFEWENRFQLTNPGENWADAGLLVEFERTDSGSSPDKLEVGLLLAKDFGKFGAAWNLVVEREVGTNASDDIALAQAFQLKYRADPAFEPGIEFYNEFGAIDDMPDFDQQEHFVGPVAEGKFLLDDKGTKLKYNVCYLFGLTDGAPDGVAKAVIELEFPL
ncbi:MAG: FTR1 family protein [Micropepsaceae bacterium]